MDVTRARELLGVGPGADDGRVDGAFRSQARVHHPDRGGDPEHFQLLVVARATLRGQPRARPRRRSGPVVVVPDTTPWDEVRSALRTRRRKAQPGRRRVE